MSYSFSVRGATKKEVSGKISVELAKVVNAQGIHNVDRPHAQEAADSFLDVLPDDNAKDYTASVSGSISGNQEDPVTSVGVVITVALVNRQPT